MDGYYAKEEFIKRSKEKFGDFLDYSKVCYKNSITKVCLICPVHGRFYLAPYNHLRCKNACKQCSNKKLKQEEFIRKSKEKFGDVLNYDKVVYKDSKTYVTLSCKKHGDFVIVPYSHLF